jgi:hypothetical protein
VSLLLTEIIDLPMGVQRFLIRRTFCQVVDAVITKDGLWLGVPSTDLSV